MSEDAGPSVPQAFSEVLEREGLLAGVETLVVACSGGGDSTALLQLLAAWVGADDLPGVRLVAGHVVHGVRPVQGERDADRVARQAADLGVECLAVRLEARTARRNEGDLRAERLTALADIARTVEADAVALAHTADDVAETVLLNAARGAGAAGLAALRSRRRVAGLLLVRPLLSFGRDELRDYLRAEEVEWGEDSSNLDLAVPRNRIRHRVLPELEAAVPGAARSLGRLAGILEVEEAWWERVVGEALETLDRPEPHPGGRGLDAAGLGRLDAAVRARVLRAAVRSVRGDLRGVGRAHVELLQELLDAATGASDLPGVRARLEGGVLRFLPLENRRLAAVPARPDEPTES